MKEIWKDIPEYEGYYQVSNLGNVRSIDRIIEHSRLGQVKRKGKILKPGLDGVGYYFVVLSKNGILKPVNIHKLVAITFLGHKPCGYKEVVDHINNDKSNNSSDNLQLISVRENTSKDRFCGASEYVGVSWNKTLNKWRSKIWLNGKYKHLGYFNDEYDAHLAYQRELSKIKSRV